MKKTILVVDDTPENIDLLVGVLGSAYTVKAATSGTVALKIATSKKPPDLILLDIMMPEMDGYEVCQKLKENVVSKHIPVIFVTAKSEVDDETKGFNLGAVDYITKPISIPIVRARVNTHLALYDQNRALEQNVRSRTAELQETRLEIIRRLGRAAEYRDNETGMHVIRMSKYCYQLALAIGLSQDEAELILQVAPMHDVGKIGIPDNILLKPDKLHEAEWEIMKQHTVIGVKIIGKHSSDILHAAAVVALTHHEQWNGQGYPQGLQGENIPLYGRIIAIADVFDALTSDRPYKKAWPVEKAVEHLEEQCGKHFDPQLLPAFLEILPHVLEIRQEYADE